MPADPDVCEVAPDDGLGLDNVLAVEDDVLGAAEHRLSADPVAGRGLDVLRLVERDRRKLHYQIFGPESRIRKISLLHGFPADRF